MDDFELVLDELVDGEFQGDPNDILHGWGCNNILIGIKRALLKERA